VSRRRVLAAVGVGTTLPLTGCLETLPFDRGPEMGTVDVPGAGAPDYRSRIPAASMYPGGRREAAVQRGTPSDLPPWTFGHHVLAGRPDWLGTEFQAYTEAIAIGPAVVYGSDTDPETVGDAVARTNYERTGAYEGYELYEREDPGRTVAVTDGTVIWVSHERGRAVATALVDARAGRVVRRHEVDEAFDAITEPGPLDFDVIGGIGLGLESTSGASMVATSFAYGEDVSYTRSQYLFSDPEAVPVDDIEGEIRESDDFRNVSVAEVRTDDRRAVVELRQETDVNPGEWSPTPQITWGADHHPESDELTLRHEAGDGVDAEALSIATGASLGEDTEGAPDLRQFADGYDTVEPGDAITVGTDDGVERVTVSFSPDDGTSILLFEYSLD